MINKKIIIAPINVEAAPNYVVRKAFENNFSSVIEFDWYNQYQLNGLDITWEKLGSLIFNEMPDYLWMQIQNPDVIKPEQVAVFARYTKVINWTGDVRHDEYWLNWYKSIGKHCHLTLFSSEHQSELLSKEIPTGYLQIGFDNVMYSPSIHKVPNSPEIVFCANNYYNTFPLSSFRREVAEALSSKYGNRFKLFGLNWGKGVVCASNAEEAFYYNNAKICISVSHYDYKRYYSDRLLRILGCGGGIALSHSYKGITKDFKIGHNLDTFNSIEKLIEKCDFYLNEANEQKRQLIVQNGLIKAHNECTWDYRVKELISLLKLT